jgi:hypothetical protein
MSCFFIARHPDGGLIANSFLHGFKNTRLCDAAQIGPHRRPPVAGHVERDGFRQFVGRCHGTRPALPRQLDSIDRQGDAVSEQGHAAVMIKFSHEGPQTGDVPGHLPCPVGVA